MHGRTFLCNLLARTLTQSLASHMIKSRPRTVLNAENLSYIFFQLTQFANKEIV